MYTKTLISTELIVESVICHEPIFPLGYDFMKVEKKSHQGTVMETFLLHRLNRKYSTRKLFGNVTKETKKMSCVSLGEIQYHSMSLIRIFFDLFFCQNLTPQN